MVAIIAVEDDPAIRIILEDSLGDVAGWVVTTVPDAAKLLEALDTVRPSLIMLDVDMPGIGGIDAYRLLRERDGVKDVPVLFVTAMPDRVTAANLTGPHAYVAKPFDLDALAAKVAEMIGEPTPEV